MDMEKSVAQASSFPPASSPATDCSAPEVVDSNGSFT
jgi:hypothetical protein